MTMDNLNLQADEAVVMSVDSATLKGRGGGSCSVALTNRNIIVELKGFFGGSRGVRSYPLRTVKVIEGKPQIRIVELGYDVHIYLLSEILILSMGSSSEAKRFAGHIRAIITGNPGEAIAEDEQGFLPEVAGFLGRTLKDTAGAFTKGLGLGVAQPHKVTVECAACGAGISGNAGTSVRCQYCGTERQL